jgi:glycosyltransferase involved in cell wall biosynthesis
MKLSIITVNLNNDTGLQKTIESVIQQKFLDYEYIIIDGGSKDGSIETINKFSDSINYWVSEQDSGIYNAMNKGISHAQGEYCFFLNSGDYFVDENVLKNFFSNDFTEDVIMGNMLVSLKGKLVGKCTGKESLTFLDLYGSMVKHQSSFIKRGLFNSFGIYNENLRIVSDYEFFMKSIGLGGASFRYINSDISCFDNDGISNNSDELTFREKKSVINSYIPVMMQPDYEFLLKFRNIEIVAKYSISYTLVRILAKIVRVYDQIFKRE